MSRFIQKVPGSILAPQYPQSSCILYQDGDLSVTLFDLCLMCVWTRMKVYRRNVFRYADDTCER